MAFVEKGITQGIPDMPYGMASLPTLTNAFNMTSTAYATAFIAPVKKTGTLTKIHFRFNLSSAF